MKKKSGFLLIPNSVVKNRIIKGNFMKLRPKFLTFLSIISLIEGMVLLTMSSHADQLSVSPQCQATVNSILNELKTKGVRTIFVNHSKGTENRQGNPTNRHDHLSFSLSPWDKNYTDLHTNVSNNPILRKSAYAIENIMASPVLMKSYSDRIVSNCNNFAAISFNLAQSDYTFEYAIQSNEKTQQRFCVDDEPSRNLNWEEMFCY